MATETWYVMEDGSAGDPREIAPDEKGVLRHKDGRAVAYAAHGPRSRSVDPEQERRKAKVAVPAKPEDGPPKNDRQMRAGDDGKPTYKTR